MEKSRQSSSMEEIRDKCRRSLNLREVRFAVPQPCDNQYQDRTEALEGNQFFRCYISRRTKSKRTKTSYAGVCRFKEVKLHNHLKNVNMDEAKEKQTRLNYLGSKCSYYSFARCDEVGQKFTEG